MNPIERQLKTIKRKLNYELRKGEERDDLFRRLVQTFHKKRFDNIKLENGNITLRMRLKPHITFTINVENIRREEVICYINMFLKPVDMIPLNHVGAIKVNNYDVETTDDDSSSVGGFSDE
jgi:hypothetical protein